MKKIFFVFVFMSIFLSGCANVKNNNTVVIKDNNIKTIDTPIVTDIKNDLADNSSDVKPNIDKCDTEECIIHRLKNCKMSQYIWNDVSGFKVIAVFGDQEGKCRVMFNDNNFKNNLSCLFDSESLKEDIVKAFVDSQYSKDVIVKNCKNIEMNFKQ